MSRARRLLGSTSLALALFGCPNGTATTGGNAGQGGGGAGGAGGSQGGAGGAQGGSGGVAGSGNTGGSVACANATGDPDDVTLAVDNVYLGDTDVNGNPSATAWQAFAFDIDGVNTVVYDPAQHCTPAANANPSTLADGPGGLDNSFGKKIIPLMNALVPDASATVSGQIHAGSFTLLVRLEGLGSASDADPVTARVWQGVTIPLPPSFDGTDCWPAAPETLATPGDVDSTVMTFDAASVAANDVDTGPTDVTVFLTLDGLGAPVTLAIQHARISFHLDPDHQGAVSGKLGGVVDREEFVEQVHSLAGSFDPNFCSGPVLDSVLTQVRQAADIMTTGQQAPGVECDAISVGIGFTLAAVQLDGIGPPAMPAPDPCP